MNPINRYSFIVVVSGILFSVLPALAQAQGLEEVVVTAQRREQNLQDVPISIDTVSGDEIQAQGFRNMEDLSAFQPSLDIDASQQNEQSIRIRGVGSSSNNLALEQSVPMFIDGIHYGRGSNVFNAFLDVERVEVLRGPQPIYFGQNATAGAVSVISRKPTPQWQGYSLAEVGNDGILEGQFGAGGPINDTLGIRVAAKYSSSDGFMHDIVKKRKFPRREAYAGRTIVQWEPMTNLQVTAKIEYVNVFQAGRGETPVAAVARPDTTLGAALTGDFNAIDIAGLFKKYNVDSINDIGIEHSGPWFKIPTTVLEGIGSPPTSMADLSVIGNQLPVGPSSTLKQYSGYVQVDYQFENNIALSSQTSYTTLNRDFARDGTTGGPWLIVGNNRFEKQQQWSQEIRLSSPTGGFIEWMVGAYWEQINLNVGAESYRAGITSISNPRSNIQGNKHGEDDRWLSGFAALTFNLLGDKLSLDVGARYTDVNKNGIVRGFRAYWLDAGGNILSGVADNGKTAVAMTPFTYTGNFTAAKFKDSQVNPQIVLRWRPTNNISTYAKYAQAFKAGGFDGSVTRVLPVEQYVYDSEFSENWEVGAKGTLLDGRANYNVTLFWNNFKDMQLTAFDEFLGQSTTNNVAQQRVRGVEFDGKLAVNNRWTLGLDGAIMNGEMTKYPGATCTQDEVFRGACTGPGGTIDRSGAKAIRTPDWTFTLRTDYWAPLWNNYKVTFNANFLVSDGYLLDFDKLFVMKSHEDMNLSMGFGPQDDTWRITVWGRNLLEPLPVYQSQYDHDNERENLTLSANQFRTYGVQLKYNF